MWIPGLAPGCALSPPFLADDTPDLRRYYPTSVMETGYDILSSGWPDDYGGLEFTEQPPFRTVYLHGLIRDEHGRKMSKSAGNAIDPLEVMDEYGTDALRFTLLTGSTPGNDMNLSIDRIAANRNFCNKIWNATRFVVNNMGTAFEFGASTWNLSGLATPDRWILSRHHRLVAEVTRLMNEYNFGEAGRQLYDFFWSEFADWYIEITKSGSRHRRPRPGHRAPRLGLRARANTAHASSLYPLCHRGGLAAPTPRRRGFDREKVASGQPVRC
jgi:valyl-tRNA synthetase